MKILFISTMAGDPWGGSEELWTRAAVLLAKWGVPVAASVHGWPELDRRICALSHVGVDVHTRPNKPSIAWRARRFASGKPPIVFDIEKAFGKASPSLVVMSNGFIVPPIELADMCIANGWPFVTLAQCNSAGWWIADEDAARFRRVLPLARRCFFISEENRAQAQRQLGYDIDNAEIVSNPVIVDKNLQILWPNHEIDRELRMACVASLHARQKGQDILLDVLASPCWRERKWRLTFYGNGPNRDVLERLVERLKLRDRVNFGGHVAVETIWRENHILIMPSRFEGGPMTTVEAMWYGRPVVATNVGLNPEVIKDGVTGFLAEAAAVGALGNALEQMWVQRDKLEEIGKLAAASIREFMPDDPVGIFAKKLKDLANL